MSDPELDQAVTPEAPHATDAAAPQPANLDRIEQDLADVEVALVRLADGSYFVDEVTGVSISDDVLERNPLARRTR